MMVDPEFEFLKSFITSNTKKEIITKARVFDPFLIKAEKEYNMIFKILHNFSVLFVPVEPVWYVSPFFCPGHCFCCKENWQTFCSALALHYLRGTNAYV